MKLLQREQLPLIFIYLLQTATLLTLLWDQQNLWRLAYAGMISLFFLLLYLLIRYFFHRKMYAQLTHLPKSLDESIQMLDHSPLSHAVHQLVHKQYQLYQDQLLQTQKKVDDHLAFINQWVHQMKTPISIINLVLQENPDPLLDEIRHEIDQIADGLELILYISRLNDFEKDFQVKKLHLQTMIQRCVYENRRMFIKHKIRPKVQVPEDCFIYSDEKWLNFICKQLISNAIRYSSGKGQFVEFVAQEVGSNIQLFIKDEGIGIPKQDIPRVFNRYFTGENGRKQRESTGMGLFLVKEICKKLGHSISLTSEPGKGTNICLQFASSIHPYKKVRLL